MVISLTAVIAIALVTGMMRRSHGNQGVKENAGAESCKRQDVNMDVEKFTKVITMDYFLATCSWMEDCSKTC